MVHTTVNTGADIANYYHSSSSGDKRGSDDNVYKDWINDMRVIFYEEADYGDDSGWTGSGGGVNVNTTFPGTPSNGVPFLRKNTNGASGSTRLYVYEGTWIHTTITDAGGSVALDDLTDVVIDTVGDLELLQFDSGTSKWINQTFAEVAYPFDDLGNPDADVNLTFGANHFHLTFTTPTTESGVILELLGNTIGKDLLHLHQHTGNPTGETRLLHFEWSHANVIPMRWRSETSAFHLYFDMETLTVADKTVTFPNASGILALTSQILAWLLIADIDDTPIDEETSAPISSNWAYDHQNNPTDIKHLTDTQLGALHPEVTSLTHTVLTGKNDETNIKHLTDAQLAALHAAFTSGDAVNAIEAVANAAIATGDSVIFTDVTDGVLKQDLVSDLLALGGGGINMSANELDDLVAYGIGSAQWFPCVIAGITNWYTYDQYVISTMDFSPSTNGVDTYFPFVFPQPLTRGTLGFTLTQVRITLSDGDGSNYINNLRVIAEDATPAAILEDGTNRTAAGTFTYNFADTDISSYNSVMVELRTENPSAAAIGIAAVEIEGYYS